MIARIRSAGDRLGPWIGGRRGTVAVLLMAAGTRLAGLGTRAFHHDEAIHAVEALNRLETFTHIYDPVYHGPFLYFSNALVYLLIDQSNLAARLLPAIAGIGMVALVPLLLRDQLGRTGTLLAMTALTLSPAFLYYSRFLRNDIYIALFTLLAMASLIRFVARPQRRWVVLAAVALGFGLVTKENTYITGFIFVSFLAFLAIAAVRFGHAQNNPRPRWRRSQFAGAKVLPATWRDPIRAAFSALFADRIGLLWAAAIIVAVPLLFFTSFLQAPDRFFVALRDSVTVWAKINEIGRVNQPWFYYLGLTLTLEPFAAILGLAGIAVAIRKPTLFSGLLLWWLALSFCIYSIAGEKAPWLALHPLLPLILLAARFAGTWLETAGNRQRWLAGVVIAVLLAIGARHAIATTYLYGDVPRTPLVYTQTSRDIVAAVGLIERAGTATGLGRGIPVYVDATSHWPLTWYLRDYSAVTWGSGPSHLDVGNHLVLILDAPTRELTLDQLGAYRGRAMRLREWFPEGVYHNWDGSSLWALASSPQPALQLAQFLLFHDPPAAIGSTNVFLYIHADLLELGIDPIATIAQVPR